VFWLSLRKDEEEKRIFTAYDKVLELKQVILGG